MNCNSGTTLEVSARVRACVCAHAYVREYMCVCGVPWGKYIMTSENLMWGVYKKPFQYFRKSQFRFCLFFFFEKTNKIYFCPHLFVHVSVLWWKPVLSAESVKLLHALTLKVPSKICSILLFFSFFFFFFFLFYLFIIIYFFFHRKYV